MCPLAHLCAACLSLSYGYIIAHPEPKVNVFCVKDLLSFCERFGTPGIHRSTDQLFQKIYKLFINSKLRSLAHATRASDRLELFRTQKFQESLQIVHTFGLKI